MVVNTAWTRVKLVSRTKSTTERRETRTSSHWRAPQRHTWLSTTLHHFRGLWGLKQQLCTPKSCPTLTKCCISPYVADHLTRRRGQLNTAALLHRDSLSIFFWICASVFAYPSFTIKPQVKINRTFEKKSHQLHRLPLQVYIMPQRFLDLKANPFDSVML